MLNPAQELGRYLTRNGTFSRAFLLPPTLPVPLILARICTENWLLSGELPVNRPTRRSSDKAAQCAFGIGIMKLKLARQ